MNQCIQYAVLQQKVSVFRCPFLDAGKSDPDTRHLTPRVSTAGTGCGFSSLKSPFPSPTKNFTAKINGTLSAIAAEVSKTVSACPSPSCVPVKNGFVQFFEHPC
jgi:hypothetical protein